ncbi:MAG: hypothetical protein KGJ78_03390 [Alphaproteobacteria bacterium]|nr:hypothetical protein [Alphaproteobacteria bacterium]
MSQGMDASFPWDAIVFLLIGGFGGCLVFFARHYRDWQIRRLQRPKAIVIRRVFGALFFCVAVAGGWAFHDHVSAIIGFGFFAVIGLYGLVSAKRIRDQEIERLQGKYVIPASRILGGLFVLIAVVSLWDVLHNGISVLK